jgi:hypothetical protein
LTQASFVLSDARAKLSLMSDAIALHVAVSASKRTRILTIVGDAITGLFVAATIVVLVVQLAAFFLDGPALAWLGIWAGLVSLLSLPALAVLHLSKPRVPLEDRSALVASASWFGRILWSAFVFSASIVIGSVAGIVASTATQQGDEMGADVSNVIVSLSSTILWPIVLGIGAVAYIVMGIRWSLDLGSIVAEGRGTVVRALLENRWTGPLPMSSTWSSLVDTLIEVGLTFVSRIALILTLITIGLNFGLAVWNWA